MNDQIKESIKFMGEIKYIYSIIDSFQWQIKRIYRISSFFVGPEGKSNNL